MWYICMYIFPVPTLILSFLSPSLHSRRVFFQVGEAPYFGQFGHFTRYAPIKLEYAVNR